MTLDKSRLADVSSKALDLARSILLATTPDEITVKADRDFASDIDYQIEREVRTYLRDATPNIGFLGEEEGALDVDPRHEYWVFDPVDGTSNLIHGLPICGSSLALISRGRPVLGGIDLPFLGERYSAQDGSGAYCNGRQLHASGTRRLDAAIVSVGDFAVGVGAASKNTVRFAITRQLADRAERVRMFGSAIVDLAWVAAGRLDASVMLANKPWDVSAGVVIAREAGAQVLDLDGTAHTLSATATVAVAPLLRADMRALLADAATSAATW
jgi:myo-inositol-1(or 4)-monophosphatase